MQILSSNFMRTILITGANKGIGFETARQLAQLGNFVYLGSRDAANGEAAVAQLKAAGIENVAAIQLDVTSVDSVQQAAATLAQKVPALDVLINNAGISGLQSQFITESSMEAIREVFDTNYFGALQTTQAMLPLLRKSAAPAIINVSSELGSMTMHMAPDRRPNWKNYSTYACTKTALNGLTVILANELRPANFIVNSVTPGYTATDLNGFQGGKHAADGAKAIVTLAMVTDRTITGKFFIDGGEVAW
jgi:NAD(P)-dependent dehydrogenase (short-subunit alcohol dehydrogenase family)